MRISDLSSDVCSSDLRQIILLRAQLLGLRAELVAPQLAEDALQPEPRLLRLRPSRLVLGQGGLRLRQKRPQVRVFLSGRGDVHAPFHSQATFSRHLHPAPRVTTSTSPGKLNRQSVGTGK